ncbi:GNAT family N-acetyltransferase [Alloalcanivorax gelatiniphagus]|uniref:GNAT family N-acetyltransferase n=1 Tax=Alloalcanivorax gelatiniphagus TaxID=1194167 RepID=A0ABY2XKD8_9GAMM|nr:GNAT family protein [Alloalcanivorax gelatiniphagus]TMW11948.1 GNAT family N-acetyltransferase [Alloalcanivorax gelatiniphagus]
MKAIETDRLLLRNFAAEDAAGLFEYLHEPRVSCFFSQRLEDMAAALKDVRKRSSSDDYVAVCLKDTGQLIGDLFAHAGDEPDTFSVGWNFNARFGGAGLATEAAQTLFQYLFAAKSTRRLFAYVEDDNVASQRLCEKLGMRHEGTFKEFVSFENDSDGRPVFVDTRQYAILLKEWVGYRK